MKKINRKTKQLCDSGITLVALIITIIILIILAAVTIKTLTHDGLINMAIKGAEDYKTAEGKELEEMNKLSNSIEDILSGNKKDPVIIEGVITFGDLSWTNNKASVTVHKTTEDSLSIEYQVLDKENNIIKPYATITNGEAVTNLNLGDLVIARLTDGSNHGNTASIEVTDGNGPTVNATKGTVTTNSIQVTSVSAEDNESGMPTTISYKYFIKPSNGSYPETASHTGTDTSYTFTGLTHKTSYDIKITTTDIAGNTGIKEIKGITTEAVPDGSEGNVQTGVITFSGLTWTNNKASVTINKTTSDNLSIEYQVLDKNNQVTRNYQTIANGEAVLNLNLGDLVVARLTDGQNHGNTASIEVTDGNGPTVNATKGTVTTNSIQVTGVSAVDNEAGMPSTISYKYFIKPSNGSYPETASHTGTDTSYTFTGLTHKTSYDIKITTTDIAGNTGIKEIKGITTEGVPDGSEGNVQTGVITFSGLTWTNNKASVTINKTTSDNLNIEYQVLDKNNQVTRNYQTIANGGAVSNLNLGDLVVARLTDGQNHGNTASIEVTDGKAPTAPTFGTPSGTVGNNGWYKSDVTVGITPGTDNESGVLKTTYSITGAGAKGETEGMSVKITAEGTNVITAYTYDKAGHKTASTALTIKIDKTAPPAVNLSFSAKTGNTVKVTTSMSSTSDTSGIAKYVIQYKKSSSSTWLTVVEQTTRPSTYTYTGLEKGTAYNFRVKTVDKAGNESTGTSISQTTDSANDPMNPNIDTTYGGLEVDYTPKAGQVYNTEGKTSTTSSGSDEYSGYGFQCCKIDASATRWKIWGTDSSYIYIILQCSGQSISLRGSAGYNNGVTLLDNISDVVYTDKITYPGSRGQNLKIEQVLAVMSADGRNDKILQYGTSPYTYTASFPKVWVNYEQSKEQSQANRSKAYDYLGKSVQQTEYLTSVKPYNTTEFNVGLEYSNRWYNDAYMDMVCKNNGITYWYSSRCVNPMSGEVAFGLQCGNKSQFKWDDLWFPGHQYYTASEGTHNVFPIISFPTSMYRLDTSSTPAKIVKK